jgi:hypothetical protein
VDKLAVGGTELKSIIALLAVVMLAILSLLALYQGLRWLEAVRGREDGLAALQDAERTRLEDERRRLLNHLREIRFDHDTGKLDADDFRSLTERYEAEAIAVLEEIDRMEASRAAVAPRRPA